MSRNAAKIAGVVAAILLFGVFSQSPSLAAPAPPPVLRPADIETPQEVRVVNKQGGSFFIVNKGKAGIQNVKYTVRPEPNAPPVKVNGPATIPPERSVAVVLECSSSVSPAQPLKVGVLEIDFGSFKKTVNLTLVR